MDRKDMIVSKKFHPESSEHSFCFSCRKAPGRHHIALHGKCAVFVAGFLNDEGKWLAKESSI